VSEQITRNFNQLQQTVPKKRSKDDSGKDKLLLPSERRARAEAEKSKDASTDEEFVNKKHKSGKGKEKPSKDKSSADGKKDM